MNAGVRRLYRSRTDRRLLGVCGGLGAYLAADPVAVRLVVVLFTLLTGIVPGAICYLVAWLIVPEEP
jgi:phage shock protein C